MKNIKWTCIFLFFPLLLIAGGAAQAAPRAYPVYLTWDLNLVSITSTKAHITALPVMGRPYWTFTVNSPEPISYNLFKSGYFGASAEYRTKSRDLAFRAPQTKQETLGAAGWPRNTISTKSNAARVSFVPGQELSALIGQTALLRAGAITPDEFKKKALRLGLRKYADRFLTNALFGDPFQIIIPVNYEIQIADAIISVSAELTFTHTAAHSLSVVSEKTAEEELERLRRAASVCRKPKRDRLYIRYCRISSYDAHEAELQDFFTSAWEGATKVPSAIREPIDNSGRTFLMRFVSVGCGITPRVGAPAVSSGRASGFAAKQKIISSQRFSRSEVNNRDFLGRTPLHYALFFGCVDDARWLLANGARPEIGDYLGNPTLLFAVMSSDNDLLNQLIAVTPLDKFVGTDNASYSSDSYVTDPRYSIPTLNGRSPLALAISNRNYGAVQGILKRKPNLSDEAQDNLIRSLVHSRDAKLLKIAMEAEVDFSRKPYGQSAAVSVSYLQAGPEEREKHKEFYALLAELFEKYRAIEKNECMVNQHKRDDCFSRQGLCSEIASLGRRDRCYAALNRCELVESEDWRWRCRWIKSQPFDCRAFKLDEYERASCELRMADKQKSLRALERLLSTRRGIETLLKDGQNYNLAFGSEEHEQVTRICNDAKYLHVSGDFIGINGYQFCANLIGRTKSSETDFLECGRNQDDSCFWAAVYLQNDHRKYREVSSYLKNRCAAGNLKACGVVQFDMSAEGVALAKRACELGARNAVCFTFLDSENSTFALEEQLLQWALEGDSAALRALQNSRKGIGHDRVENEVKKLQALCKETMSACRLLYDHYMATNYSAAAEALMPLIQSHARQCVNSGRCNEFRGKLARIPELRDYFLPECKKGNFPACEVLGAEAEDPLRPTITLAQLKKECPGESFIPSTLCYSKAAALLNASSNDTQAMKYICLSGSVLPVCSLWLEHTEQQFAINRELLRDFEHLCTKDGAKTACLVVGGHHLKHDAARAASFLKKTCEEPSNQTGDCAIYIETLARLRRPKELNRYLDGFCSKSPEQTACTEKEYYRRLAGEMNGYDKTLTKQCKEGNVRSCSRLKELVEVEGR